LAKGKKVLIITTRGGAGLGPGEPMAHLDAQVPYLKQILGFIGITDVSVIYAGGLAGPDEARQATVTKALAEIKELGRRQSAAKPAAAPATNGTVVKSREELNRELREGILRLPSVTERRNAGIHEDAFFVGRKMFMHIHGHGHCDIRLSSQGQERVLSAGLARKHRWAPEQGYVTFSVNAEKDLEPAMELIRMSHQHFHVEQEGE